MHVEVDRGAKAASAPCSKNFSYVDYTCNSIYCILRERIKGFNSAIIAIMCQVVVMEL